jgi:GTP-binding protein YchF
MGFRCGIVGLPNVGKSTVFNALTAARVPAENYPFCTLDSNVGRVPVPDDRLPRLQAILQMPKVTATSMEFVDIAGLVRGAHQGEGLGNRFLSHIRDMDALAHVVRCFHDPNVAHVQGAISPRADIEVVNTELLLADLETVERALSQVERRRKVGDKAAQEEEASLRHVHELISRGEPLHRFAQSEMLHQWGEASHLLTAKPLFYIANLDEEGLRNASPWLDEVEAVADAEGSEVVPLCARLEAELAEMAPEEAAEFSEVMGLPERGITRLIRVGYRLLGQAFFESEADELLHAGGKRGHEGQRGGSIPSPLQLLVRRTTEVERLVRAQFKVRLLGQHQSL